MYRAKHLGCIVIVALTLAGLATNTASGATLEINGVAQNGEVTITKVLKKSTSTILKDTFGFSTNTCTEKHWVWDATPPFTWRIFGTLTSYKFQKCDREVVTHKGGSLSIEHIGGTTNGTVSSSGAEVTTGSPFGTLNCKTGEGTHLGTLTGVKEGHATMDVNAVTSCGGVSTVWQGSYEIASPTGLGVTA